MKKWKFFQKLLNSSLLSKYYTFCTILTKPIYFISLFNKDHLTRLAPMVISGGQYSSIVIIYRVFTYSSLTCNVRVQINILLLCCVNYQIQEMDLIRKLAALLHSRLPRLKEYAPPIWQGQEGWAPTSPNTQSTL